jgi:CRISPR-associated protein Cas2
MWVMILFDLPTGTKTQQKAASKFRKDITSYGFNMFQYSIYIRHCPSKENADMHINRVKGILPKYGKITIFSITDKQFGSMETFHGRMEEVVKLAPQQLSLF